MPASGVAKKRDDDAYALLRKAEREYESYLQISRLYDLTASNLPPEDHAATTASFPIVLPAAPQPLR